MQFFHSSSAFAHLCKVAGTPLHVSVSSLQSMASLIAISQTAMPSSSRPGSQPEVNGSLQILPFLLLLSSIFQCFFISQYFLVMPSKALCASSLSLSFFFLNKKNRKCSLPENSRAHWLMGTPALFLTSLSCPLLPTSSKLEIQPFLFA